MNKKFENQNIALLLLAILSGGALAIIISHITLNNFWFSLYGDNNFTSYAILSSSIPTLVLPAWIGALFIGSGILTFSKKLREFFGGEKRTYLHSRILFIASVLIVVWTMIVSAFPFLHEKFDIYATATPTLLIIISQIYILILSVGELLRRKFEK